ncbi:MAG: hypothetical protein IJE26_03465, partial [Oscillospiraceae bacterium]|nr:hypothetical protein [Oscillospiraceae bacterium]
ALPWDLGSLGAYYTGRFDRAAQMAEEALRLSPGDNRIQDNIKLIYAQMMASQSLRPQTQKD